MQAAVESRYAESCFCCALSGNSVWSREVRMEAKSAQDKWWWFSIVSTRPGWNYISPNCFLGQFWVRLATGAIWEPLEAVQRGSRCQHMCRVVRAARRGCTQHSLVLGCWPSMWAWGWHWARSSCWVSSESWARGLQLCTTGSSFSSWSSGLEEVRDESGLPSVLPLPQFSSSFASRWPVPPDRGNSLPGAPSLVPT